MAHRLLKGMNAEDARGLENAPQEDPLQNPAPQPKLEDKVEEANRIVAQLLEVADAFRMTFSKAMNLARSVSHPQAQLHKGTNESYAPAAATGALDKRPLH